MAQFFFMLKAGFFYLMLSLKAFAKNSLKQNFLWDVWFGCDADYDNIQTASINSNRSVCKY